MKKQQQAEIHLITIIKKQTMLFEGILGEKKKKEKENKIQLSLSNKEIIKTKRHQKKEEKKINSKIINIKTELFLLLCTK